MKVLNSKGQPISLTTREDKLANSLQRQINSLGYEVAVTTLTAISKKISEQKFFEVAPADYIPVVVGEGSWSSNILTYRSFEIGDQFETGIINTGAPNTRLATADAGVDSVALKVFNWAKAIGWSLFDVELASRSGNWDIVEAKEKARKKNYDLGIQRVAFLGARGDNGAAGSCLGLLNQPGATVNTTTVTKAISSMTPTELKAFVKAVVENFRENCQRTAWPTHFVLPESDYLGLASQASDTFPIRSTLNLLEEAFKTICKNPNFKIQPLAYADATYHADVPTIAGKQVYALYNSDEETMKMVVPVPYTNTLANSIDNFNLQNVGYSQFTGLQLIRPLELLYFTYNA